MTRIYDIDNFIRSTGLEAYRVGGSVRDEILGRKPKDADYVVRNSDLGDLTTAVVRAGGQPSKLKLRDGRQIGVRANVRGLGLIEIALPRKEVARERREGESEHGAFDILVDPTLSLDEDAERRDFRMNAIYRAVSDGSLIDPLDGVQDIDGRIIATAHPHSFRDDPLRILRALRFVAQGYGRLGVGTQAQMEQYAYRATGAAEKAVSGTSVTELNKLLMGDKAATALRLMRDTGVMIEFLPELKPMIGFEQQSRFHNKTADEHTFDAIDAAVRFHASLRVRLGLLFHDAVKGLVAWMGHDGRLHYYAPDWKDWPSLWEIPYNTDKFLSDEVPRSHEDAGAENADAALMRLPYPKDIRKDVVKLVKNHMVPLNGRTKPSKVRRWRAELGDELLADLFKHRLADVMSKTDEVDAEAVAAIARLEAIRQGAERDKVPTSPKGLFINGQDLIALGFEGREIGVALDLLLKKVLAQPSLNNNEWLVAEAHRIKARRGI